MPHNPRMPTWSGQRAWIVGASSGIGRAVALALLDRGASVTVSARSGEALGHLAAGRPGCTPLVLDVQDPAQIATAARQVLAQGPLDLMLYCAGHYLPQRATAYDTAELVAHLRTNYEGALHAVGAVLPAMLARGQGHLSLVGSVAGYTGLPNSLAYGPTKAALINFAQTLHYDLHPRGLGVSIVNPGFVRTPLTAQNAFRMPALIEPEEAAVSMLEGWSRGDFEIHFPRRFSLVMKAIALLPFGLRQAALRRVTGL